MKNAKQEAPAVPAVVVRSDSRDPAARAGELEAELALVTEIMGRHGIAAAGIRVTGPREIELNREGFLGTYGKARTAAGLIAARTRILADAEAGTGLWNLPDAMLVWDGVGVTLYGDERPGEFWEFDRNRRRIVLVPAVP